ncbi:C4-dicarboxylate ABC transporter permease [Candidatus Atribacteria bacterium HGW-Atribacteria-1]|nr:MAG: C4-dicarboxylate ABC transporter permease [Candidatus Atribacteria bacterium HGW-Atribacteria-1]
MKMSKLLAKINMVLEKIEEVILCVGVSILAIILIVNVIARKAGTSIYFIDEIAMFLVIWITFIGLSYASRKGRHIRMAAIFDLSSVRVQKMMIFVISAISAMVMFYLTYISVNYVYTTYRWQQVAPALRMPYWIGIAIVPVGFSLAGIHYVRTIVKNIKVKEEVWVSPEQKSEYE